jgi:hypothetical protein
MILKIMGVVKGSTSTITISASEIIACGLGLSVRGNGCKKYFTTWKNYCCADDSAALLGLG